MDNFNQVGATKFCVVAKVSSFKINLLILLFLQDALDAMKALGLNPGEQEMIDMTNEVGTWQLVAVFSYRASNEPSRRFREVLQSRRRPY